MDIQGTPGNDDLRGTTNGTYDIYDDTLFGKQGDDILRGLGGDDTLYGDEGNDTLIAGKGSDTVYGGSGNDRFVYDYYQNDDVIMDFVQGEDKIDVSNLGISDWSSLQTLIADDTNGNALITVFKQDVRSLLQIRGISKNLLQASDFIFSTVNKDEIIEGSTNGTYDFYDDTLFGGLGNDILRGLRGSDTLYGGAGNDTLNPGRENDILYGGTGNDTFIYDYSQNDDVIMDFVQGEDKIDVSNLGISDWSSLQTLIADDTNGNALITVFKQDVRSLLQIRGISKNLLQASDFIFSTVNKDEIIEGSTNGTYDFYNDTLFGGLGNDTLKGLRGSDTLYGEAGNDILDSGRENDNLYGGTGNDTFIYDYKQNDDVIMDFVQGQDKIDVSNLGISDWSSLQTLITNNTDRDALITVFKQDVRSLLQIRGISKNRLQASDFIFSTVNKDEIIEGSTNGTYDFYDDTLFGGLGNDTLKGLRGSDTLYGEAGNDILDSGRENDNLYGGTGNDTFIYDYKQNDDVIIDFVQGEDKIDLSRLGISDWSSLQTLITDDTNGNALITVFKQDIRSLLQIRGISKNLLQASDFIFSTINKDEIIEGSTNGTYDFYDDTIFGGLGNDILRGLRGSDTLYGGAGNDTLNPGRENDILYGGTGNDTFIYDYYQNNDIIMDFVQGGDKIDVSNLGISDWATLQTLITSNPSDGDALITTVQGDIISRLQIKGVSRNLLQASDFIFSTVNQNEIIEGTSSGSYDYYDDELFGGLGNDTLRGLDGTDILHGEQGNDSLDGGARNDKLYGGGGSDTLIGGLGDDFLVGADLGSIAPGRGEIDRMSGGAGKDRFILGNGKAIFYDDGNITNAGAADYALITDFNINDDVIELSGSRANYYFSLSGGNSLLYFDKPGNEPDELIAIIEGLSGLNLNSAAFTFNVIDTTRPVSNVVSLTASRTRPEFTVTWTGSDSESGIASYDVFVSTNGGQYTAWKTNVTETSGTYVGAYGSSYRFYSIARDKAGNIEQAPTAPDQQINLVANANPGTIAFSSLQFSVNENGTLVNAIRLTRSGGSDGAISTTIVLTDGTAIAASDYTNTPITVNFANGETSKTITIPIVNDSLFEPDETLTLTLSNPTGGATLGTQRTATLTIVNDDIALPSSIVTGADFNRNGKTDLIWRNYATGQNAVWLMDGTSLNQGFLLTPVADVNWSLAGTGDFDRDGQSDLLWRNYATGDNVVWLMDGTNIKQGLFTTKVADLNWSIVGTGDFNQDGQSDIVWRNYATGDNVIWLMEGTTIKQGLFTTKVADLNWSIAGTGDFNRDGQSDIVWRNYATGDNVIWLMEGTNLKQGFFTAKVADLNWNIAGTGDFNQDGQSDLIWRNGSAGKQVIWLMDGTSISQGLYINTDVADTNWRIGNAYASNPNTFPGRR